jgi:hypothetical protein
MLINKIIYCIHLRMARGGRNSDKITPIKNLLVAIAGVLSERFLFSSYFGTVVS